jgi:magnesium transporter
MVEHTTTATDELLESWAALSKARRIAAFQALPREDADDFFLSLSGRDQAELVLAVPLGERRIWLRLLAPDDAADLIQHAPEGERASLVEMLDESTRNEVSALLAYKEDAAGGLMNPRFARLRPEMTVDEAISYLRRQGEHVATIYYGYALDSEQSLLGIVALRDLFTADKNKTIREIMRTRFVSASEDMDQEALAALFAQHHLLAIPVVDRDGHMKGIVTVDDIAHAVEQEATEDIQKIGGMEALDEPYLQISFLRLIKKRAGWLAILFLGEMLTATAMGYFEEEIARAVVLALFVPLIISSGGNSGAQAATLVVRALAIRELRLRDWWRVVRREIAAGLCLGAILGSIGLTRILVWQAAANTYGEHYLLVAATVAFSLVGVVLWGTLAGSTLPFILRRFGLDPASASAPFVATLVDVTGLVIYFTVASVILRGTLL